MKKDRTLTPEEKRLWRQAVGEDPAEKPLSATPSPPAKKTAPKKSLPALPVQTGKQAKRAITPRGEVEATLDLHGLSKLEAYEKVQRFIERCHAQGKRHLLIITGKGRTSEGVLRRELPHWLNEPALRRRIGNVAQGGRERGGEGVFHVLLKRS